MKGEKIPARVYVLNSSEAQALKKLLEYDPYLDPNKIPKISEKWDDPEYFKKHPEEEKDAEQKKRQAEDALNQLKNDREANIIFARQDYQLRDGVSMGLEREKSYLYLSADDSFLNEAEPKLKKNVPSIERAQADMEKKVIEAIEAEREKSDQGLGFIFG